MSLDPPREIIVPIERDDEPAEASWSRSPTAATSSGRGTILCGNNTGTAASARQAKVGKPTGTSLQEAYSYGNRELAAAYEQSDIETIENCSECCLGCFATFGFTAVIYSMLMLWTSMQAAKDWQWTRWPPWAPNIVPLVTMDQVCGSLASPHGPRTYHDAFAVMDPGDNLQVGLSAFIQATTNRSECRGRHHVACINATQAMDAFMTLDCRRDFLLHFEVFQAGCQANPPAFPTCAESVDPPTSEPLPPDVAHLAAEDSAEAPAAAAPTPAPTPAPTEAPTEAPTKAPTKAPTEAPPTATSVPDWVKAAEAEAQTETDAEGPGGAAQRFCADDSQLEAQTPGLGLRVSKDMTKFVASHEYVKWGTVVPGADEGDGWVKASNGEYLPKVLMGQPVLKRMVVVSMLINLRFSEMAMGDSDNHRAEEVVLGVIGKAVKAPTSGCSSVEFFDAVSGLSSQDARLLSQLSSVLFLVYVTPPEGKRAEEMEQTLVASSDSICQDVEMGLAGLPGIGAMQDGEVLEVRNLLVGREALEGAPEAAHEELHVERPPALPPVHRRLWNSVHEAEEAVDVTHQSSDHDVDKEDHRRGRG